MAKNGRVRWVYNTLTPNLARFHIAAPIALDEIIDTAAEAVEQYAKANAPWEDRTGMAREGLTAEARHSFKHHEIILYHTVDYGIWLEIAHDGDYAIIEPTIDHMGPVVMHSVEHLFPVTLAAI